MTTLGSKTSFGRSTKTTAWQRFNAWQQFRRTQLRTIQLRNQNLTSALLNVQKQKSENLSISAAQAALNRIREGHQSNADSLQGQISRLVDRKV